jgi:hypothetical protein
MAKHTPGPWRIEGRFVKALKNKCVAELPCGGVLHAKVDTVNARLIAAALDLLGAAYATVRVCEMWQTGQLKDTSAYKSAVAAIAKAEGRAP